MQGPRRARRRECAAPGRPAADSQIDDLLELCETRGTDSRNGVELVDRLEGPVFVAVIEDLLRRNRADPGQRVELLERRRVQMNGAWRRRAQRGRRTRGPTPASSGNDHLLSVRNRGSEVDELEVSLRFCAAGHPDRVV